MPSTGAFIVVPEENEKSEPFSNRKQVRIFLVWWARVDYASRAAKNSLAGCFCPAGRKAPGRSCSHPPAYVSLTFAQKKTASVPLHQRFFHGRGWIRTTEAEKQQIYSLSPLATREHAHIQFFAVADCLYILPLGGVFVNCLLQLVQKRSGPHGAVAGTDVYKRQMPSCFSTSSACCLTVGLTRRLSVIVFSMVITSALL